MFLTHEENHIVSSYTDQIITIKEMLNAMRKSVNEMFKEIEKNINNFDTPINVKSFKTIKSSVKDIDMKLEDIITSIIALRQPVGNDLRFIISSIKSSSLLRSIAKTLYKSTEKASQIPKSLLKEFEQIFITMLSIGSEMINYSIDKMLSFDLDTNQPSNVYDMIDKDDIVDQCYKEIKNKANNKLNEVDLMSIVDIITLAKNFEKIADHATLLLKLSEYVITGERVN